jgi:serine phosphatase RsbU (regulator of sigma subunit)
MRQRREISDGLQAALLPPSLPVIPGLELGARYEPAGEGLEVGGDFYDVVPVAANQWLLVVGDVTGHGVEAAAVTGLMRHTIHSAAMMKMRPAEILDHVNQALLSRGGPEPSATYCTVALAALTTPGTGSDDNAEHPSIVVASAGHPAPMLRRADGTVEALVAQGRLLGYFPTIDAQELHVELGPGDTFVAFTDGVIERHDDGHWFRERELTRLIADSDLHADALAGLIRRTVLDAFVTPPGDDMAILVVRRRPE